MTLTLKQAIENGDIDRFVKDHKKDSKGEKATFDATLRSMAGKSKPVRKTLPQDDCGD